MNRRNHNLALAGAAVGLIGAALAVSRVSRHTAPRQLPPALARSGTSVLARATLLDTLAILLDVVIPTVAKGVIVRRPAVVAVAERLDLDRRAVQRMQKLRDKYGPGPLMLKLPLRKQAVLFDPDHVHRVLAGTPEPFSPASSEKRAALVHLEPMGALISEGEQRAARRALNETALEHEHALHSLAPGFTNVVEQEASRILAQAQTQGELTWTSFEDGWFRMVRRVIFGEAAAEDQALSEMTLALREAANWAFLRPPRRALRQAFLDHIRRYLAHPQPDTLAALLSRAAQDDIGKPAHQVPQWLFAFDPAGMATYRALALLAAHPEHAAHARDDINNHAPLFPYLRAAVLESLRLWPTSPLLLRQTTRETSWDEVRMPAHTGILIFAPFFHRDSERLEYADVFRPNLWLATIAPQTAGLIPFSEGPAICPGRNVVLLLTSAMLAALLRTHRFHLVDPVRMPPHRLPGTLDHYSLRFRMDKGE